MKTGLIRAIFLKRLPIQRVMAGWGTWIRTKTNRVRVCCATVTPFPTGMPISFNQLPNCLAPFYEPGRANRCGGDGSFYPHGGGFGKPLDDGFRSWRGRPACAWLLPARDQRSRIGCRPNRRARRGLAAVWNRSRTGAIACGRPDACAVGAEARCPRMGAAPDAGTRRAGRRSRRRRSTADRDR